MGRNRIDTTQAYGTLAFGSVTAAYATLVSSVQGRGICLHFFNSLDAAIVVSLDGGTTDWGLIPAGLSWTIDLGANDIEYSGTSSVKDNGAANTSGFISCSVTRTK